MPFLLDTFTDVNGTLLENHTPEIGGVWTKITSTEGEIQSNAFIGRVTPAQGRYQNEVVPPSPEYDITVRFEFNDATQQFSILNARYLGLDDHYTFRINIDNDEQLWVEKDGDITILDTNVPSPALLPNTEYLYVFECRNDLKRITRDGVEILRSTDNRLLVPGKIYLQCQNKAQWNDIEVEQYVPPFLDVPKIVLNTDVVKGANKMVLS